MVISIILFHWYISEKKTELLKLFDCAVELEVCPIYRKNVLLSAINADSLTLNDDDAECQELVWRGQEGQGMLISDIGSGPKEVTLGHRAMVLQPDLTYKFHLTCKCRIVQIENNSSIID